MCKYHMVHAWVLQHHDQRAFSMFTLHILYQVIKNLHIWQVRNTSKTSSHTCNTSTAQLLSQLACILQDATLMWAFKANKVECILTVGCVQRPHREHIINKIVRTHISCYVHCALTHVGTCVHYICDVGRHRCMIAFMNTVAFKIYNAVPA